MSTGFAGNIFNGTVIAVNFVSDRLAVFPDGSTESQLAIAARLRFDVHLAMRLRDQLNLYIASIAFAARAGGQGELAPVRRMNLG